MRNNETWTAEMREKLRKLWNSGLSAAQISIRGDFPGKTSNAIIGQVHRMRVNKGVDMRTVGQPVPKPKKPRGPRKRYGKGKTQPKPPTPLEPPPPPPASVERPLLGRPLVELERTDCRFIVTPHMVAPHEHRYCAADASRFVDDYGNNCYCRYHQRLMRAGAH